MGDLDIDNNLGSDPASDIIQDIISGARRLKIVCETLEAGLFDEIETFRGPVSSADVATKCHFSLDVTERLFNTLVCLKLLEKITSTDGAVGYKNSTATTRYLLCSKRPSMIACCLSEAAMVLPALDNLAAVLRGGTSETIAQQVVKGEQNNNTKGSDNANANPPNTANTNPPSTMITNNDKQMMFMLAMEGMAASCAPAIARAFDLSGNKTAADLGGASGCIAFELSRTYPNMCLTVFELPHVAKLAKKLQPEDTRNKVQIVGGDFFKDSLPPADLYIIAHVIHNWDIEKTDILLSKVYRGLPPGGSLLLLEKTLNEDKDGPWSCISMDLVMAMISKGRERTPSEYQKLLKKHGFSNTQFKSIEGCNYYDAILAKKPF
ncbi:acetylserotonin O-methyltransferase-like [Haliotis rufescens]|uniref:acetylserotonin O-methyltransferase-like n=1 Tax=Haliotis rufescens TaxID=6454 RepID=UPI001EB08C43|nr:acetylserotonin O-methyltransferase-like [Haliotis rufescens]